VAPTIIKALGFDPNQLEAVQKEQTSVLAIFFNHQFVAMLIVTGGGARLYGGRRRFL
jgi:hypothetical protein